MTASERNACTEPLVTVAICTYNRADLLGSCLNSLLHQKTDKPYAILVIDNNSTDDTRAVALGFAEECGALRYCFEECAGLSHARNRAIDECETDWLAFIDDDALAGDDWIEAILRMIELDAYDAFGGIYVPWYKEGKRSWFLDEYASNEKYLPYTETCELTEKYLCGNNCAFRLAALGTDLRFPEDLGMTGNVVYYGEEILVQNQLRRRGFRIGFSPEMTIEHLAPLSKQNLSWIKISSLKSGESNWAATNQAVSIRGILLSILSIPYRLAIELTPALARLLTGRYRPINVYIVIIRIWYNRLGKVRQGLRLLGR